MKSGNISWEIVLAGIAFSGIAIYLMNHNSTRGWSHPSHPASMPAHVTPPEAPLPSSIVIDLNNLESLKNLENLKNLKNIDHLKNLEIKFKNLEKVIDQKSQDDMSKHSIQQSLEQIQQQLQQIDKADYKVKLQNSKVYIKKDYDVKEATWTEVSPGVYAFRESVGTSDINTFDLVLNAGNLNITGSDDQDAELLITATGDLSDPQTFKNNLDVAKYVTDGKVSFNIGPKMKAGFSDHVNLEATLTLPKDMIVDASTSGGHIQANNLSGKHHFVTSGGHIILNKIDGTSVAKTGGGHINCDNVSGTVTLTTSGGNITVRHADGTISAKTGGGHIELLDLQGKAEAKTSGGNITAVIHSANGPINLVTSAGNISLNIPPALAANLDAKGTRIELSDKFNFDGSKTNGKLSGTLNNGGIPISLTCGYGNIIISNDKKGN